MALGPPQLGSTVARFSFPVVRIRFAPDTVNADGLATRGAETRETIQAHVFPATRQTLATLPQGYEAARVVEGHSVDPWSAGDEDTQVPPDQMIYRGKRYRVITSGAWTDGPAGSDGYYQFTAAEMSEDP